MHIGSGKNPEPMLSGNLRGATAEMFASNYSDQGGLTTVLRAFGEHAFIGLQIDDGHVAEFFAQKCFGIQMIEVWRATRLVLELFGCIALQQDQAIRFEPGLHVRK